MFLTSTLVMGDIYAYPVITATLTVILNIQSILCHRATVGANIDWYRVRLSKIFYRPALANAHAAERVGMRENSSMQCDKQRPSRIASEP